MAKRTDSIPSPSCMLPTEAGSSPPSPLPSGLLPDQAPPSQQSPPSPSKPSPQPHPSGQPKKNSSSPSCGDEDHVLCSKCMPRDPECTSERNHNSRAWVYCNPDNTLLKWEVPDDDPVGWTKNLAQQYNRIMLLKPYDPEHVRQCTRAVAMLVAYYKACNNNPPMETRPPTQMFYVGDAADAAYMLDTMTETRRKFWEEIVQGTRADGLAIQQCPDDMKEAVIKFLACDFRDVVGTGAKRKEN